MRPARRGIPVLLAGLTGLAAAGVMAQPAGPNPLAALSLDQLKATREAPLFTPSRTAPPVEQPWDAAMPTEALPEPAPTLPEVRLMGIMRSPAEQVAILADKATGEVHRVRSGEAFLGWEVRLVDARSVELKSGEQVQTLTMFVPGSEAPAALPGAAGPGEGATVPAGEGAGAPPEESPLVPPAMDAFILPPAEEGVTPPGASDAPPPDGSGLPPDIGQPADFPPPSDIPPQGEGLPVIPPTP